MHKFSLYEDATNLKIKLRTSIFLGEASWNKSANICKGDIIPVLMRDKKGTKYLHSMKWGTNLFDNDTRNTKQLQNQARADKLLATNNINNPWLDLVSNGQRCVIVAKGFYINGYTEIINAKYKTKYNDKQPYFITPYVMSEGEFFYIAALYRVQQLFRSNIKKYSVVSITKSTKYDDQLQGYIQRMPYLLRPRDVNEWLNPRTSIKCIFSLKYKIHYNKFQKIGLWLNNNLIKDENKILRSRLEWDLEKDATMTGMHDDNFPWDEIEKEALKQNSAQKNGIVFQPKSSWDILRAKGINNEYNLRDTANDKRNNNKNRNIRKRRKNSIDNQPIVQTSQPLNKKQKLNDKQKTSIDTNCYKTQ